MHCVQKNSFFRPDIRYSIWLLEWPDIRQNPYISVHLYSNYFFVYFFGLKWSFPPLP